MQWPFQRLQIRWFFPRADLAPEDGEALPAAAVGPRAWRADPDWIGAVDGALATAICGMAATDLCMPFDGDH